MRFYRDPIDLARAIEAATRRNYIVGVDLGTARDYTAVSVIEVIESPLVELNTPVQPCPDYATRYELRHVQRLRLGLDYASIVDEIARIVNRPPIHGDCSIGVDYSGVGRPVYSMLGEAGIKNLIGVQITGGTGWTKEGSIYNVSKPFLMSGLLKAIHKRTLRVSPDLDEFETVRAELQDLRTSTTQAGYVRVEAAEGRHDDVALSIAVAVFVAVHRPHPAKVGRYLLGG
jgi:hypothetical protein